MRARWKPILALLLITPFVTELLSGSLPASKFFQPQVFLFLATVGYGFPVLLLREFAVRRQLGLAGLFLFGLVYGIYNEGILAKTFYLATNVPVKTFDGYGYTFGIAIPWAITISIWHALHSFIYPLVAVGYFFPEHRPSPWLNRTAIMLLAIPVIVIGSLTFFHQGNDRPAGLPVHFILMMALSGLLLWLATRLKSWLPLADSGASRSSLVLLGGLACLALLLAPILLSRAKVSVPVFYGCDLLLLALIWMVLRRQTSFPINNILLFAVGDDTLLALFGLVAAIEAENVQRMVANVCFIFLFCWLFARLRN